MSVRQAVVPPSSALADILFAMGCASPSSALVSAWIVIDLLQAAGFDVVPSDTPTR